MKKTVKTYKEVEVKTLSVEANVRYWEGATVNGIEDVDGSLIPCRNGDNWCPVIDIDTGLITNWTQGTVASIHYKVCDAGTYRLLDEQGKELSISEGYVPKIMCPEGGGFGDYIIMGIDENGKIANWEPSIDDFFETKD